MVVKKNRLGKGLGALIPDEEISISEVNDKENPDEKMPEKQSVIPINLIKANQEQPRRNFDADKLFQLSESIKEHGIIEPLVLNKEKDDTYSIIAGERRWRAAKIANINEVPAVVMNLNDKEILEISLIENIQREDLNPIEEAIAYKKLIEEFGLTQEDLAKKIGKSRTSITNCMRLLNLDKRVQAYLIDGVISEGHGRALLALVNNDLQYETAQMIIDENLSVRDTENLVKRLLDKPKSKNKNEHQEESPYIVDIKDRLESLFGTKVSVKNKKDKGKIEIEYYSTDDLQRILEILDVH